MVERGLALYSAIRPEPIKGQMGEPPLKFLLEIQQSIGAISMVLIRFSQKRISCLSNRSSTPRASSLMPRLLKSDSA